MRITLAAAAITVAAVAAPARGDEIALRMAAGGYVDHQGRLAERLDPWVASDLGLEVRRGAWSAAAAFAVGSELSDGTADYATIDVGVEARRYQTLVTTDRPCLDMPGCRVRVHVDVYPLLGAGRTWITGHPGADAPYASLDGKQGRYLRYGAGLVLGFAIRHVHSAFYLELTEQRRWIAYHADGLAGSDAVLAAGLSTGATW